MDNEKMVISELLAYILNINLDQLENLINVFIEISHSCGKDGKQMLWNFIKERKPFNDQIMSIISTFVEGQIIEYIEEFDIQLTNDQIDTLERCNIIIPDKNDIIKENIEFCKAELDIAFEKLKNNINENNYKECREILNKSKLLLNNIYRVV